MQSDDEPASDVAVKMTQTRSKPKNNGPSQDQMFEERKESLRPKKSRRRAALQEPQTLDTPKVKKRRGRPRKMLEESVLSKSNGQKVQEAPDQNNRGLKSLEVLPTRMQMSYDALAPRGLAEFLEGDGHIDSLSAVDGWRADSQPPGDQYERFEWDWDRPLPDIVTGEVQPRMGPLVEKDGHNFFWDVKNAKWRSVKDHELTDNQNQKYFAADLELQYRQQKREG